MKINYILRWDPSTGTAYRQTFRITETVQYQFINGGLNNGHFLDDLRRYCRFFWNRLYRSAAFLLGRWAEVVKMAFLFILLLPVFVLGSLTKKKK